MLPTLEGLGGQIGGWEDGEVRDLSGETVEMGWSDTSRKRFKRCCGQVSV